MRLGAPQPAPLAYLPLLWLVLPGTGCLDRPSVAEQPATAAVESPVHGDSVDVTLFLIGDAGAPAPGFEPVLAALTRDASAQAGRTLVAFLGDNIYPRGMPPGGDPERAEAERRLEAQLAVLRHSGARGIFVPGNHDWAKHEADGWHAMRRQAAYIAAHGGQQAVILPQGGCPGPAVVDVGTTLRLLLLDTQWWLHDGPKPDGAASGCATAWPGGVTDSLRGALRDAGGRVVAVLAHHPLRSGGPHGSEFGWMRLRGELWIPLPPLGSWLRKAGSSSQDLTSSEYRLLRDSLRAGFATDPPLLYAAGHDHSLQVLRGDVVPYHLVSGAGTFGHASPVEYLAETLYAHSASGYARLDVLETGRVRLSIIEVNRQGTAGAVYSQWLY